MEYVSTPRGTDPVALAGSVVWALVAILLALVTLRVLAVASGIAMVLAAVSVGLAVAAVVSWRLMASPSEPEPEPASAHPLDGCARTLHALQQQVLPGPVHDHLDYLRHAVDTERHRGSVPSIAHQGRELVAAAERLVVAHHDLVDHRLAEPLARTEALEASLRAIADTAASPAAITPAAVTTTPAGRSSDRDDQRVRP